jgi:hypothetical protein
MTIYLMKKYTICECLNCGELFKVEGRDTDLLKSLLHNHLVIKPECKIKCDSLPKSSDLLGILKGEQDV